jgi:hypothetical protein
LKALFSWAAEDSTVYTKILQIEFEISCFADRGVSNFQRVSMHGVQVGVASASKSIVDFHGDQHTNSSTYNGAMKCQTKHWASP